MRTILVIILTKFGQDRIRRLGALAFVVRRKKKKPLEYNKVLPRAEL